FCSMTTCSAASRTAAARASSTTAFSVSTSRMKGDQGWRKPVKSRLRNFSSTCVAVVSPCSATNLSSTASTALGGTPIAAWLLFTTNRHPLLVAGGGGGGWTGGKAGRLCAIEDCTPAIEDCTPDS